MKPVRIVIADDHTLVAQGLKSLLEPEFQVVSMIERGDQVVAANNQFQPDVIIIDITMPGLNGIEAIRQLRSEGNTVKAVVLTMNTDAVYSQRAFEAGACGYVLKSSVSDELVSAIHEVMSGNIYVTPKVAGGLLGAMVAPVDERKSSLDQLTRRQQTVLRLVAEGYSAKQAAAKLGLSRRTVESHKYRIMRAVGVQTTAELIRFAVERGVTSEDCRPTGTDRA